MSLGLQSGERYFIWALVENQPNIVEKLVGFLRRSCRSYRVNKLYFGPAGSEGACIFAVEVECRAKAVKRLVKVYGEYVEVIDVGFRPVTEETVFSEVYSIQRTAKG